MTPEKISVMRGMSRVQCRNDGGANGGGLPTKGDRVARMDRRQRHLRIEQPTCFESGGKIVVVKAVIANIRAA